MRSEGALLDQAPASLKKISYRRLTATKWPAATITPPPMIEAHDYIRFDARDAHPHY
ncbi:MAG: hypothetical protein ACI8W7_004135 [Gammaproteobacteria bacterium]|jgi:hypothetical protein